MKKHFIFSHFIKVAVSLILIVILIFVSTLSYSPLFTPARFESSSNSNSSKSNTEAYPLYASAIEPIIPEGLSVPCIATGKYFYIQNDYKWDCTFLKGVNMGLTLPTTDLNDPNIPYDTFILWFDMISKMNVNTIKVFTIMNPDFYRAFYDFNIKHLDKPLYLLHGLWFNEDYMYSIGDAYSENGKILNSLKKAAREAVDIIHGKSDYTSYGSNSPAIYDKDISKFVIGWILGLEWAPEFVVTTNKNNSDKSVFNGRFLKTESATPFESFLGSAGDYLIEYESINFKEQRPVAFLNWQSTDILKQDNEPFPEEDMVQVDTEHILSTDEYFAGLFAAIDIYPYYPEFMNYQAEYISYKNKDGSINSYRGYLKELKKCYSVPLVVAEVGLSTSRGVAHNSVMGYNQGGLNETQQGEYLLKMIQDIAYEGYAGSIIFSWQDEWFKQTWNTYKFYTDNPLNRTPNKQSAEQNYGILAYEAGDGKSVSYPDGDFSEWGDTPYVFKNDNAEISVKYDEAYLYIMGKTQIDLNKEKLAITMSTTGRGNLSSSQYGIYFEKPTDFLLVLDGEKRTRLLVDAAYDYFYYKYSVEKEIFPRKKANEVLKSGLFNPIYMFTSNEISLPKDGKVIPPQRYEAGLLKFGNANPSMKDFNSLSDFYFKDNSFEIRIPWYLLNVLSPTQGKQMGNFYSAKKGVSIEEYKSFWIGAGNLVKGQTINMTEFTVERSEQSTFHARLKKSYDILSKGLLKVMPKD